MAVWGYYSLIQQSKGEIMSDKTFTEIALQFLEESEEADDTKG